MRILFLHEVNYLEKPIFEMHEFPEHLASIGHQVAFMHFAEGWTKAKIKSQGFESKISGRVAKDAEITLFTPQVLLRGLIGRLIMALRAGNNFRKVVRLFKPDVVVSFSVPTSGWQALKVSKKFGIPFVFRALDVSHKIRKTVFASLTKAAESYIYSNSDWISANNRAMREYCISMGAQAEVVSVDYPPLDLGHFQVNRDLALRAELGIPAQNTVFLYMGSFFYFSGLPKLIEDFARRSTDLEVLLLVGGGEQDIELREKVRELKIQGKVRFTGFVPFQDLPSYLAIADVALNPMQPSLVSHTAFPNKVIQYMAAGLPVVSTGLRGLEATFEGCQGIKFVAKAEEIIPAAREMIKKSSVVRDKNRQFVGELFLVEHAVSNFESLLKSRIQKGHNA